MPLKNDTATDFALPINFSYILPALFLIFILFIIVCFCVNGMCYLLGHFEAKLEQFLSSKSRKTANTTTFIISNSANSDMWKLWQTKPVTFAYNELEMKEARIWKT